MHRSLTPLFSLLLAVTLLVPAAGVLPAQDVYAVEVNPQDFDCPPTGQAPGDGIAFDFFCAGDGGPDGTVPVDVTDEPWCASGWGRWSYPRYADPVTGSTALEREGTAVDPSVLEDVFQQAWSRASAGFNSAFGSGYRSALQWHDAIAEVTALILQMEKDSTNNSWIFHSRSLGQRGATWSLDNNNQDRTISYLKDSSLKLVPNSNPAYAYEMEMRLTVPNGTRVWITAQKSRNSWFPVGEDTATTDPVTGGVLAGFENVPDGIIDQNDTRVFSSRADLIAATEDALSRYETVGDLYDFADRYLTPFKDWTINDLPPNSPLKREYLWADGNGMRFNQGRYIAYKWLAGSSSPQRIAISEIRSLPIDARVGIVALTPNRESAAANTTYSSLFSALLGIVNRNLTKERTLSPTPDPTIDIGVPRNWYAFPAFHAPSKANYPMKCQPNTAVSSGRPYNSFTLMSDPLIPILPNTLWDTTSFNGCHTTQVGGSTPSLRMAAYRAAIVETPGQGGRTGDACWLNWRITPIPEPVFVWSNAIAGFMPQVVYHPSAEGTVGQPIKIVAHRNSQGYISYGRRVTGSSSLLESVIPWTSNLKSEVVCKGLAACGVELQPTYFNLTQVGLSAEIGVPGSGGTVLQRITRTDDKATTYDFSLIFDKTPLEILQTPFCKGRTTAAELLKWCGIGYDAMKKEWYYRVDMRPWYGGVYYAPATRLLAPRVRGLFNDQTTKPLPAALTAATPEKIRDYTWGGSYQDWSMSFDGVTSPRFVESPQLWSALTAADSEWIVFASLTKNMKTPAYTYKTGSYYPIADASGTGTCASPYIDPGFSEASRCYVKVFVRSRQPILDR